MSGEIGKDPDGGSMILIDGDRHCIVPRWAQRIIREEHESEVARLREQNAELRKRLHELYAVLAGMIGGDAL